MSRPRKYNEYKDNSDSSQDQGNDNKSVPSRRQLLTAVGSAGIAGFAGCTGGGQGQQTPTETQTPTPGEEGGTKTETPTPTETPLPTFDRWFVVHIEAAPKQAGYNPYNPSTSSSGDSIIWHQFLNFRAQPDNPGWMSRLLDDWSVNGKSATLKLVEDLKWNNGNSVTAEDALVKLKLEKFMKAPIDDYAANISTEGDYTVNLDLRSTVSESVFGWTLAGLPLDTPAPVFKKYVNSFKEATTEDEMKAVRKRLTGFKFREPLANGPGKIKLESLSSASTLTMPVNEKHPHADAINWNGWKGQLLPSNQKEWQALSAGALDGTQTFMPPNVAAGMPDFVHIHVIDQWVGEALAVNHRRKPFDNRKFRQAMSHIIKSENIANKVAGDSKMKFPRKYFTGTSRSIHKEFLTPIEDQLTIYGQGDTKKAASLLKEAGFSKQKGQWMMPNGNAVKFTIKTDSCCNDWVDGARTAAAHLSQFGIKAQFTTMEGAALWSDFSEGNFDVIGANWGSYGKRAAYFDYRFEFNSRPASTGFDPTSVQIDSLPNGEGGKLNLKEMAAELSQLTGADAKNRIQDLAYAYDQVQPQIMLMEKASQTFMTTDQWEFPSLDNPNMWIKWPHYWLPKNGLLKAKEKE